MSEGLDEGQLELSPDGCGVTLCSAKMRSVDGLNEHSNQYKFTFDKVGKVLYLADKAFRRLSTSHLCVLCRCLPPMRPRRPCSRKSHSQHTKTHTHA